MLHEAAQKVQDQPALGTRGAQASAAARWASSVRRWSAVKSSYATLWQMVTAAAPSFLNSTASGSPTVLLSPTTTTYPTQRWPPGRHAITAAHLDAKRLSVHYHGRRPGTQHSLPINSNLQCDSTGRSSCCYSQRSGLSAALSMHSAVVDTGKALPFYSGLAAVSAAAARCRPGPGMA